MQLRHKLVVIFTTISLLLFIAFITHSNQEQNQALLFEQCGIDYNNCQTDCIHISTSDSNNKIAQCRNHCYKRYLYCRKGR